MEPGAHPCSRHQGQRQLSLTALSSPPSCFANDNEAGHDHHLMQISPSITWRLTKRKSEVSTAAQRRHLDRQLHALRSRLHRLGAEDLATSRQPVRAKVVTHVLGTICHPCVRAGQMRLGGRRVRHTSVLGHPSRFEAISKTCALPAS
jgi:hypothetical protein